MVSPTFGTTGVDWESRLDIPRLRRERLDRLKTELERSDLGALLTFDFHNIRYMTSTHIGTWAMDKMIRFALLPRGGDPVLWDFGSAARHHQLFTTWLDEPHAAAGRGEHYGARAGISTLRGAISPGAGLAADVAAKVAGVMADFGLTGEAVGRGRHRAAGAGSRCRSRGFPSWTASRSSSRPAASRRSDEIGLLTQAASMVDAAYEDLYAFLRPGVRENECVGLVSKKLFDLGSEHVEGVNAISGERCSPHPHVFSDRLIRPGDPAFFDILHSYQGYRTCYYRTFAVGSASAAQRGAYKICRELMDNAIRLVQAGRHHRRDRAGVAHRAGVRLRRRGGRVRAAVRPRRRPQHLGAARSSAGSPRSRTPRRSRSGRCSPSRRTGRRTTAGAPHGSRRRSWSPRTAARSSRSSPRRTCS